MTLKPLPHAAYDPAAGTMAGEFDGAFKAVDTAVRQVIDDFNAGVKNVYDHRWVLGPLLYWVQQDLKRARDGLDKVLQIVRTAFEHHLPVVSLIYQSFGWLNQVKAPMTSLAGRAAHEEIVMRSWSGPARDVYNAKRDEQVKAIGDVGAKADFISGWLKDLAINNVAFMTELMRGVTDLVGKFAGAAIKTATVVGIPAAASDLGDMVADAVTKSLNALTKIAEKFMAALGDAQQIVSKITDRTLYDGGNWPQAVRNH